MSEEFFPAYSKYTIRKVDGLWEVNSGLSAEDSELIEAAYNQTNGLFGRPLVIANGGRQDTWGQALQVVNGAITWESMRRNWRDRAKRLLAYDDHQFLVSVTAETREQAVQVMGERINHDEDYGFFYRIGWREVR